VWLTASGYPGDRIRLVGLVVFGVLQAIVYLLVYKGFGKARSRCSTRCSRRSPASRRCFDRVLREMVRGPLLLTLAAIFVAS